MASQPIARYIDEPPRRPLLSIDVPPPHSMYSTYSKSTNLSYPLSASSASSSCRSPGTEISSAPTSATSITASSSIDAALMEPPPAYWLQCTFRETGCKVQFYPQESEAWRSHCLSHFNGHSPPKECICIFCDKTFHGSSGWTKRMSHIEEHLAGGHVIEQSRPDFALYRHMYKKGLLREADYRAITSYTECQHEGLGLQPLNYQIEKVSPRDEVVCFNQRKEDREREKAHRSKGKGREKHRN